MLFPYVLNLLNKVHILKTNKWIKKSKRQKSESD